MLIYLQQMEHIAREDSKIYDRAFWEKSEWST